MSFYENDIEFIGPGPKEAQIPEKAQTNNIEIEK